MRGSKYGRRESKNHLGNLHILLEQQLASVCEQSSGISALHSRQAGEDTGAKVKVVASINGRNSCDFPFHSAPAFSIYESLETFLLAKTLR